MAPPPPSPAPKKGPVTIPQSPHVLLSPGGAMATAAMSPARRITGAAAIGTPAADPHLLLDTLDSYTSTAASVTTHHSNNNNKEGNASTSNNNNKNSNQGGGMDESTTSVVETDVDPIGFLNRHYTSEQILVQQLPGLREAVGERMERLDDRISNALQRQSETADLTRRHVQDSKASVEALINRIHLVQEKASQSESAVLEITRDMKRMDLAKKHLQRTITTLKRLHMLIHAVEQLRLACLEKPFPDYKTAAHLVDATRLLLQHFEAYSNKVEPLIKLSQKVTDLQEHLRLGFIRGFRIAYLGIPETIAAEAIVAKKGGRTLPPMDANASNLPPPMTPAVMEGGVLLMDALGQDQRRRFIIQFCQDQLKEYKQHFQPVQPGKKEEKRVSSFKVVENPEPEPLPMYGLESVEKRFVWFRDRITRINQQFPKVFPPYWNMQYSLCRHFLVLVRTMLTVLNICFDCVYFKSKMLTSF